LKRQFLVFADKMFARSEGFIHQSYKAFDKLQPVFIGSEQRSEAPAGTKAIALNPFHGPLGEMGFKQFGLVSPQLKARLEQERPVLIHAHFGKSAAYALPLARAMGLPLAVTYHGGDATKTANTRNSALRIYNRRRADLWREAALILPVSEFIKGELAAAGCPPEKMTVNYNGADAGRFAPGEKAKLILFAGRWVEKKGVDTLVSAGDRGARKAWRLARAAGGRWRAQAAAGGAPEGGGNGGGAAGLGVACGHAARVCRGDDRVRAFAARGDGGCGGATDGVHRSDVVGLRDRGNATCGDTRVREGWRDGVAGRRGAITRRWGERLVRMTSDVQATQAMGDAGREVALKDFNLERQSARLQDLLMGIATKR
jgi:glycosyltransferase involved in cell wall biosynthesis